MMSSLLFLNIFKSCIYLFFFCLSYIEVVSLFQSLLVIVVVKNCNCSSITSIIITFCYCPFSSLYLMLIFIVSTHPLFNFLILLYALYTQVLIRIHPLLCCITFSVTMTFNLLQPSLLVTLYSYCCGSLFSDKERNLFLMLS